MTLKKILLNFFFFLYILSTEQLAEYKCGSKRCEVCKYITETDSFTSTVTGETIRINHRFDCNNNCLVYLMACNKYKKQYTGLTTDQFHGR